MLISTRPPEGDISLSKDYFDNTILPNPDWKSTEFVWDVTKKGKFGKSNGVPVGGLSSWLSAREIEVARTYYGDVALDKEQIKIWFATLERWMSVCDDLFVFVPPIRKDFDEQSFKKAGDRNWKNFITRCINMMGYLCWIGRALLSKKDFMNINHVFGGNSSKKITHQIIEKIS